MKAMTKGLMTIVMLAATAACDGVPTASNAFVSTTEEPAFAKSSRLTFNSTQSYTNETPATATAGNGSIDFTGSLTTGTPCYDLSATHTSGGGDVTVTVSAASTGGICTQVVTNNNYQGSVTGLAAGTYTFTVIHDQGGSSTVAQTSTVVVQ